MTSSPMALRYGPWWFDPDRRVLIHDRYEVEMDSMKTSAETLDWICQLAAKGWVDDSVIGWFAIAIADILQPQANLCSMGSERGPIDAGALITAAIQQRGTTPRKETPISLAELLSEVERIAIEKWDGHVTILRFTTHWKVRWGTCLPEHCQPFADLGVALEWLVQHPDDGRHDPLHER